MKLLRKYVVGTASFDLVLMIFLFINHSGMFAGENAGLVQAYRYTTGSDEWTLLGEFDLTGDDEGTFFGQSLYPETVIP